ncbi:unnamed protein product [Polarella glacialis]|uniref:Uncharacterized protein n=1 Tax=Polarella glacialis TaxID=89957 RepID=A0A813GMD2_POLGL|nr:unnamed protein product [Polarella glacialis]
MPSGQGISGVVPAPQLQLPHHLWWQSRASEDLRARSAPSSPIASARSLPLTGLGKSLPRQVSSSCSTQRPQEVSSNSTPLSYRGPVLFSARVHPSQCGSRVASFVPERQFHPPPVLSPPTRAVPSQAGMAPFGLPLPSPHVPLPTASNSPSPVPSQSRASVLVLPPWPTAAALTTYRPCQGPCTARDQQLVSRPGAHPHFGVNFETGSPLHGQPTARSQGAPLFQIDLHRFKVSEVHSAPGGTAQRNAAAALLFSSPRSLVPAAGLEALGRLPVSAPDMVPSMSFSMAPVPFRPDDRRVVRAWSMAGHESMISREAAFQQAVREGRTSEPFQARTVEHSEVWQRIAPAPEVFETDSDSEGEEEEMSPSSLSRAAASAAARQREDGWIPTAERKELFNDALMGTVEL